MKRWIERALNVRPGDLGRGVLLCSCLFLVICSYKIGGVAGAALFLSRFQAQQLAYAQISSSVLVAVVIAGYVLIARRVLLRDLLVGSMVFFSTTCSVFWGLAHFHDPGAGALRAKPYFTAEIADIRGGRRGLRVSPRSLRFEKIGRRRGPAPQVSEARQQSCWERVQTQALPGSVRA